MSGNCRQFATDRNLAQRESQQTGTHLRQVPCFGTLVAAGVGLNTFNLELMTWVMVKASGQD